MSSESSSIENTSPVADNLSTVETSVKTKAKTKTNNEKSNAAAKRKKTKATTNPYTSALSGNCGMVGRVYLLPWQIRKLNRMKGALRATWNWALDACIEHRKKHHEVPSLEVVSKLFTERRNQPKYAWLKAMPRDPFQQVLRHLNQAWQNHFKNPDHFGEPTYKAKYAVKEASFSLDARRTSMLILEEPVYSKNKKKKGAKKQKPRLRCIPGRVRLPGLGVVRFRITRPFRGRVVGVVLSETARGCWSITFKQVEGDPVPYVKPSRDATGIDAGMKSMATDSHGKTYPVADKLERKLASIRRCSRKLARQRADAIRKAGGDPRASKAELRKVPWKRSNRYKKAAKRCKALNEDIANLRKDTLHKASRDIVSRSAVICMETLNLKGMQQGLSRGFRRSFSRVGLGELIRQVLYKAAWQKRIVVKVGKWYPSSKLCHQCGYKHTELKLKDRHWDCPHCGAHLDRDLNAAQNIEREGMRLLYLWSKGVDIPSEQGTVFVPKEFHFKKYEPSSILKRYMARTGVRFSADPCKEESMTTARGSRVAARGAFCTPTSETHGETRMCVSSSDPVNVTKRESAIHEKLSGPPEGSGESESR